MLVQIKVPRSEMQVFDRYCAAVKRPRPQVIRMLVNHLTGTWKKRLSPEGWARFLKGELTPDDVKRATEPLPIPSSLVIGDATLKPFDNADAA